MVLTTVLFLIGLVALLGGAEVLVRGAASLARRFGVSPLVIGLTVVAFGTSSPELAVSLKGAFSGQADVALGNVVGSNLFNTFAILGICAVITPLVVAREVIRREVPLMVATSFAVLLMALDGAIGRIDGVLLLLGFVGYTGFLWWQSRRASATSDEGDDIPVQHPGISVLLVVGGLVLLVLGSQWFVDGAIAFARLWGVSERVIALTVVAVGTSLPELVTSLVAVYRGERDIGVGNVVGSNLFNFLAILGVTGAISSTPLVAAAGIVSLDLPIVIASAVACLPVFASGARIDRWEGAIFIGYYVAYTAFLVLSATQTAGAETFTTAMIWFVIPITVLTLLVIFARERKSSTSERRGSLQPGD